MGYKIVEDKNLVLNDGTDLVYKKRSVKERLFSKLYGKVWKPFKKYKLVVITKFKPDSNAYVIDSKQMIVCHPQIANKIREQYRIYTELI